MAAVRKNSGVQQTASDIARFLAGKYVLTATARVIMWRETIREYCESRKRQPPEWVRDSEDVHRHFKRYGTASLQILQKEYGITVIKVSNKIRRHLKHGELPLRDERRTDAFYRQCIPSSAAPTFGIVCFPRDSFTDHPLVISQLERRGNASASGLANALQAIDTAETRGAITSEMRRHIASGVLPGVAVAIEQARNKAPAIAGHLEGVS